MNCTESKRSVLDIKVKELTKGCIPKKIEQGDWIDLYTAEDTYFRFANDPQLIPLGIAMELPYNCEAIIEPRSSTLQKYGIVGVTGVIDESY